MKQKSWWQWLNSPSDNRKSKIKNPKLLRWLATLLLLTGWPQMAGAQQVKIPWIGYLAGSGSGPSPAFILGLRDLGYVEGKNIGLVFRTAEGRTARYADLVAELVRLKVDITVTDTTGAALALKKATSTIPIVMTDSTDPVRDRARRQLCPARRECNRANKHWRRVTGKSIGSTERDRAKTHSCGYPDDEVCID